MLALAAGYLLPELLRRRGVQLTLLGFTALVALLCAAGYAWLTVVDAGQGARLLAEGGLASFAPPLISTPGPSGPSLLPTSHVKKSQM